MNKSESEFQGQFCEKCAPGHTRETPSGGQFVKCVPCKCNNHGESQMPCDPETGACNCANNTEGLNCETCKVGYYGNATVGLPGELILVSELHLKVLVTVFVVITVSVVTAK